MTDGKTPADAVTPPEPDDSWENAAKFVNDATTEDGSMLKEIRAYADDAYLNIRVTASADCIGTINYLDVSFCEGHGTTSVWWGWTTTGTNTYWKEHKGKIDAAGVLETMKVIHNDVNKYIIVRTEKTDDSIMWYLSYPREYVAAYEYGSRIYLAAIAWFDWNLWAVPARGNSMLEVNLNTSLPPSEKPGGTEGLPNEGYEWE